VNIAYGQQPFTHTCIITEIIRLFPDPITIYTFLF
jgi:hypothetical protein